ncbi:unnamed protein product [Pieris macdunnoughi]|uniref:Uncharacterized protein n=1 Tax=Pieris macdunnoughi TaxID=345717 RepID=A0A821LNG1_9NEOP|nr:unnamed protein product [Pieris macdunnoughi]
MNKRPNTTNRASQVRTIPYLRESRSLVPGQTGRDKLQFVPFQIASHKSVVNHDMLFALTYRWTVWEPVKLYDLRTLEQLSHGDD